MAEKATSFVIGLENVDDRLDNEDDSPSEQEKITKSLIAVLRAKYCMDDEGHRYGYFGGKPPKKRTNSEGDAELAYLTNVCLSNSEIRRSGLPQESIKSLCPNVVDLDISGNFLDSWNEILPLIQQLKNLKFLNIAQNMITKNKDVLHGWTGTLPNVENLVLNKTGAKWQEVLHLAKLLPQLKELHVCRNNYKEIPEGSHPGLHSVECLRMNDNFIVSWDEVWKLRHLSNLKSLILSGNPLTDIHYRGDDLERGGNCNTTSNLHDNPVANSKDADGTSYPADSNHVNETVSDLHDSSAAISKGNDETAPCSHDNSGTINNNLVETFQVEVRQYCENILNSVIDEVIRNDIVKLDEISANGEEGNKTKQNENNQNTVSDEFQNQKNGNNLGAFETQSESIPVINERSEQDYIEQLSREIVEMILRRSLESVTDGANDESAGQIDTHSTKENDQKVKTCEDITENRITENGNMAEAEDTEESTKAGNSCCLYDEIPSGQQPFNSLETLCISETHIGKWKHLSALRAFPALKSVRIKNVKLGSKLSDEDRRKLFLASLPNVKLLNGSEVSPSEREKSERFLLRHFSEKKLKPDIFPVLEQRHGKLAPLVDIDISKGYTDYVNLSFVYHGKVAFTETVCVREKFGTLRKLIASKLKESSEQSYLYHKHCNSRHEETIGELQEIRGDGLPMSRLDLFDGDEIHIDDNQLIEKWRLDSRFFNRQT